jgi:DNA-binding NarL/FixJ family response regulator
MNSILVVVMNVGLAAVVYLLLVRRIDRKLEPGRVLDNIRSEIDGIIVELNQTTDRNIGLLEDRVNRLNGLLEQADRRLAVLKREIESRSGSTERYNDIVRRAPRTQQPHAAPAAEKTAASDGEKTGDPPANEASEGRATRKKQIVELHRKGIASNIIANRTGTTVGEVELIISLADRKE